MSFFFSWQGAGKAKEFELVEPELLVNLVDSASGQVRGSLSLFSLARALSLSLSLLSRSRSRSLPGKSLRSPLCGLFRLPEMTVESDLNPTTGEFGVHPPQLPRDIG
jgi:hypothetical protein